MFKNDIVESVYANFHHHVVKTPSIYSPYLSELIGAKVYLKLENMQRTGSFKERGVISFLSRHPEAIKHVVTASAGNHAQALAFHAARLGIKATIFMPEGTSNNKVSATEKYKANVMIKGSSYEESFIYAQEFALSSKAKYVHAYNDLDIILGQATVALEIMSQVKNPEVIIVPVGGGGLIAGISRYIANLSNQNKPKIIGVHALDYKPLAQSLAKGSGQIKSKTIAEGIAVKSMGDMALAICSETLVEFVGVLDIEIQRAIVLLLEMQKIVVEGAGAASVAAVIKDAVSSRFLNKNVVLVISGGNIDSTLLCRLSSRELVTSSRLWQILVVIKDMPGSLSAMLAIVTKCAANIIQVRHERTFASLKWNEVLVYLTIEIKHEKHKQSILKALCEESYRIKECNTEQNSA
jgi:threonine dehydratase